MMQEIVKNRLAELGLSNLEAARVCGITGETMTVLAEGYTTLPSLAVKVGHGLGLKREQVREIGQALDREAWERRVDKVTKGQEIDFDPGWWQKYRCRAIPDLRKAGKAEEKKPCGRYLDIRKVAEWAMANELTVREVLRRADIDKAASTSTETGARKVAAMEREMGLAEGALRCAKRPITYKVEVRTRVRKRAVVTAMEDAGMTLRELAERMGYGYGVIQSKLSRTNNECYIELPFARRMADAIGRPVTELFRLEVVETVYRSRL